MADHGQSEVQDRFDRYTSRGFVGEKVDPEPNEVYTVAGVTGSLAQPPAASDKKSVWVDYAVSQGLDRGEAEALTKDELHSRFGG